MVLKLRLMVDRVVLMVVMTVVMMVIIIGIITFSQLMVSQELRGAPVCRRDVVGEGGGGGRRHWAGGGGGGCGNVMHSGL